MVPERQKSVVIIANTGGEAQYGGKQRIGTNPSGWKSAVPSWHPSGKYMNDPERNKTKNEEFDAGNIQCTALSFPPGNRR